MSLFRSTVPLLATVLLCAVGSSSGQDRALSTDSGIEAATITYNLIHTFSGTPDGAFPTPFGGAVIEGSDGNYYGTTAGGGANTPTACAGAEGCGTIFKVTPSGTLTILYSFCSQLNCADGFEPANLSQGGDGNFYGVTQEGGANAESCQAASSYGCGTVFKITPSGTLTTLYSFCAQANCKDGVNPNAGLIEGSDGNFYGMTQYGGTDASECNGVGCGVLFKITSSGAFTILHQFCSRTNCTDGAGPVGGLLQGSDGNFYGGAGGGAKDEGTIFKITSSGTFTTVYSFCSQTDCTDGIGPVGSLVEGSDGNFYGTTALGGANTHIYCGGNEDGTSCGTVFKVTSSGTEVVLYNFCSLTNCADGDYPLTGLFLGSDGNLYGTTIGGGAYASACSANECGTAFQVTPLGTETVIHSFCSEAGCPDGRFVFASLLQGDDGSLYGTTEIGGSENRGVVYGLSPSPVLAAPVQLSLSASSISLDNSVTLTWSVLNAFSTTMQQCYAFVQNSATGSGTWTGLQPGTLTSGIYSGSASITPTATGTYTYALTCGGIESGFATLTVTAATTPDITFSSVTHNMGSVLIGNSTTYGVQLTNHTPNKFPFALTLSTTASPNPFSYQTNCGTSVPADSKCEIVFTYAPKSGNSGTQTATWFLAPNGFTFGPSNGGTLTGSVATAAHLTVTTAGHNWGDQTVGTTSPVYGVVLTNSTPDNINMTYALGNTTDFSVVTNCPALLGAGVSCNLNFTFTPKTTGFLSTTESLTATDAKTSDPVTIYIKGSSTPVTGISLKGTGVAP